MGTNSAYLVLLRLAYEVLEHLVVKDENLFRGRVREGSGNNVSILHHARNLKVIS
jgi:hypothetical protein